MSKLPEPNFIERNPEQITRDWIALYEEKTGKVLQPAQIERILIDVCAYREMILRVSVQETAKQNLLSYAPLDILKHIGAPLGVEQLLAQKSKTTFKIKIEEPSEFDFLIPAGTEIETKDGLFIFETIDNVILAAGELEVIADGICKTAGAAANNYLSGSINNLLSPLDYEVSVENITTSGGGADDEDAGNLRERIRQAPEKFSNAGSVGAYRYHAFSANQNITDVAVISPSPGVVNVYPLTKDGNPNEEMLEAVQNYLNADHIRPLTDLVEVISPENTSFDIIAIITLYSYADAETVLKAINLKLEEYKKTLSEKLGKNVVRTQIIAILNSIYGVFKVDLLSPEEDIEIGKNEWADLENRTIVIGGYADE
jgi:phage-related baseplate assembly protein